MVTRAFLKRLKADAAAVAMTEFALAAPLMLTVGLYGLEMANYAITHLQISQAAMHVADNASRIGDTSTLVDRKIYEADINDLLYGVDLQAGDGIDLLEYGRVIVSSLEVDPDDSTGVQQYIHWQRCKGKKNFVSSYGVEGDGKGDPSFVGMGPAGEEVIAMEGEAVIFVEVSYTYQPIVTDAFISDREITVFSSFNVRDSRDISQIYQADPTSPDTPADCGSFTSYKPAPTLPPSNSGGWNWNWFNGGAGG
ncbi:MAG: pilus assembly protein [Altererythrobacter sp.]|nr:pilus assembly protein [Altererythrobacter sp.]